MNILWLSHMIPYPPKGGMLQRSFNLLRETARYHDVYLLAFNQSHLFKTYYSDAAQGLAEVKNILSEYCKAIEFIPIPSEAGKTARIKLLLTGLLPGHTYTVSWLDAKLYQQTLQDWLNRYHFDVAHVDTISLAPYIKNLTGIATVLNHHNIESHMMLRRTELENNPLKKFYFWQEGSKLKRYETLVCPQFDMNITCSDLDAQRLQQHVPGIHAKEVANGVDTEYFAATGLPQKANSLIFAGGLSWYPNIDAMLFFAREIWPLLKEQIPDISMNLIGKNPPQELVELGKNDSHFIVHGFVDDVRPYLEQAAVYVCPIRDGGGTKLKILDALCMQKAIVADARACEGIAVENGKNVLFATQPEEYVQHIKFLLENEATRISFGQSGRQLIENNYSYVSIGKKLSAIYSEIQHGK